MTPTPHSVIVGKNLKRLRENRGWSAEYVADSMGISTDSVYKYESGQRKMPSEMIVRAAVMLRCNIMDIFAGTDPRRQTPAKELHLLSADSSSIMTWLASEWEGDIEALVRFLGMVASFPPEERRDLYMDAVIRKDRLIADGSLLPSQLPPGLDYMEQQLGKLYEEVGHDHP